MKIENRVCARRKIGNDDGIFKGPTSGISSTVSLAMNEFFEKRGCEGWLLGVLGKVENHERQ